MLACSMSHAQLDDHLSYPTKYRVSYNFQRLFCVVNVSNAEKLGDILAGPEIFSETVNWSTFESERYLEDIHSFINQHSNDFALIYAINCEKSCWV